MDSPPALTAEHHVADETRWEIAGVAGYLAPPTRGAANPFGAGFGGRLGVAFEHLYLGVSVVDYLGGQDVDLTTHALTYGGEVGYQFQHALGSATTLTFRPSLGLGAMTVFYTTPASTVDVVSNASSSTTTTTTTFAFYMQPAATLMLSSGWAFAGVKPSATIVPSVADGLGGTEMWLVWGLEGELGIRW